MRTSPKGTVNQEPLLWSGVVAGLILLLGWGMGSQFVFPSRLATGVAEPPPVAAADAETRTRVTTALDQLPLLFIENRGQLDPEVAYYIQGRANTLYFTPAGVTFALTDAQARAALPKERRETRLDEAAPPAAPSRWVVKLDFLDANPQVKPQAEAPQQAIISYFKGKPEDWQTGLKTYGQLRYPNLWPGIDLVYSGTVNRLKYHFEVQPGADPRQIRLAYRGASAVMLTDAGQLDIVTPVGGFQDDRPVAWQEVDGQRVEVAADYALAVPGEDSQAYGFRLGSYDPTRPLLLDPAVIVYAGYIGGDDNDAGSGIAVDGTGAAYVTGTATSTQATFPVKIGPNLISHNDICSNYNADAFVAKVQPDGSGLVYAGYIGGCGWDGGSGIAVDGAGAAYVTGSTLSTEATFPVKSGPDLISNIVCDEYQNCTSDAFVAKVRPDGTGLVYAGYIGGNDSDGGSGIAVDRVGAAYVTGLTESAEATFPVKSGPDLTFNGGSYDAFVAKVRPDGTGLVYAGYIGGNDYDDGTGIAVDGAGAAYVTGETSSTEVTFPVKTGPDQTYNGNSDAFVAKVRPDGTDLVYAGYIGGSDYDWGYGIAVDGAGAAYVAGTTGSTEVTFPVKGGPDLTHNGGYDDAFVAKVAANGTGLVYAGYIGGSGWDQGYGITVDGAGAAYVAGTTGSTEVTFPVKTGPDLTFNGGSGPGGPYGEDAFVAKVRPDGAELIYAGYIGGFEGWEEYGVGIAVYGGCAAFVTGYTTSTEETFPVQGGPDLTYNGGWVAGDAFVAKIKETTSVDGDLNCDVNVDINDFKVFQSAFGACTGQPRYNPEADYDGSGCINFVDYQIWYQYYLQNKA